MEQPALVMEPLPKVQQGGEAGRDWGPALGNMETAKLALDALRGLITDAVFLDEEAYTNSGTLQLYQQRLQVRRRCLLAAVAAVVAARSQQHAFSRLARCSQRYLLPLLVARCQAQQRRILQLEGEVEALRVEAGRHADALRGQRAATRAAEARITELQQELDNNAGEEGGHAQQHTHKLTRQGAATGPRTHPACRGGTR